jgi:chorismate mutase
MIAIRGAITVEQDTEDLVKEATVELMNEIIMKNKLLPERMVSILFTATQDIQSVYPGKFVREELNIQDVAILHFQEMHVSGSLPLCLRVLIHYNDDMKSYPIYLRKAKKLRPDLDK